MENIKQKKQVGLLLSAIGLGFLFEWFFVDHHLGISYPLFVMAFYGVFFWFMREKLKFDDSWFFFGVIVALSAAFGIFANEDLARINFYLIPGLIVGHTLMLSNARHYSWNGLGFIGDIVRFIFDPMITHLKTPFEVIRRTFGMKLEKQSLVVFKKVLKGIVLAIPLLILVVGLLSSADLAFRELFNDLPNLLDFDQPDKFFKSTATVVVVTLLVFSFIWSHLSARFEKLDEVDEMIKPWDPVVTSTVLVLVNIVYLIFVGIQFSYLFGGDHGGLIDGYIYSEYARRGFFELLFVAFVNFVLLVGMISNLKKDQSKLHRFLQAMKTLLVLATFVIMYSSHFRLSLYESVFGYTRMRLYPHFFVVLLGMLFVVALVKIWTERLRLWKSVVVVFLAWYVVFNYVNIDALIARKNIDRYVETQKIDINYLGELSPDAFSEILRLEGMMKGLENRGDYYNLKNILDDSSAYFDRSWQSYNWSRDRMLKLQQKN